MYRKYTVIRLRLNNKGNSHYKTITRFINHDVIKEKFATISKILVVIYIIILLFLCMIFYSIFLNLSYKMLFIHIIFSNIFHIKNS